MQIMVITNSRDYQDDECIREYTLLEVEEMVNKFIEGRKIFDIKHNINFKRDRDRPIHYFTILYED